MCSFDSGVCALSIGGSSLQISWLSCGVEHCWGFSLALSFFSFDLFFWVFCRTGEREEEREMR